MSYDYYMMKLKQTVERLDDLRPEIIEALDPTYVKEVLGRWRPDIAWREPDWGQIRGTQDSFDFRLHPDFVAAAGGPGEVAKLSELCRQAGWTLIDPQVPWVIQVPQDADDGGDGGKDGR